VAGEPCASGSAVVLDEARARAALHEEAARSGEPITFVDAALLFSAPAGIAPEPLHHLGGSLAEVAAAVTGVREVALELSPEGARADLALLLMLERGAGASEVLREVEAAVARVPGALLHPPEGSAEVEIAGDELDPLLDAAGSVQRALGEVARVVSFGADRAPELRVEIDRERAARLGVTEAELTRAVLFATAGEIVTHYRDGTREHAVRVRTTGALEDLTVTTATGSVPLREVATLTQELAVPVIYRCCAQRCVHLAIDGEPDALEQARERLPSIELPAGVTLRWRDSR
jgi:multidrug efflux pump subunit AcrB